MLLLETGTGLIPPPPPSPLHAARTPDCQAACGRRPASPIPHTEYDQNSSAVYLICLRLHLSTFATTSYRAFLFMHFLLAIADSIRMRHGQEGPPENQLWYVLKP